MQRLLAAIDRSLADTAIDGLSDETRFDAACKAVMQCALVAILAAGYRPSTSEPGHHQTLIQSLPLTPGVANEVWVVLDALRRQRIGNGYTGQPISPRAVTEYIAHAKALRRLLRVRLPAKHPQLVKRSA